MNILLTGATGFLGSQVFTRLPEDATIYVLARNNKSTLLQERTCNVIPCDLTDISYLKSATSSVPKKLDTIIHMAAHVPKEKTEDDLSVIVKNDIGGTLNLLEAFGQRANHIIFTSSIEIFGKRHTDPIDENIPVSPDTSYGVGKITTEAAIAGYCKRKNISYTILRLAVLYGAGDTISRLIPNTIEHILQRQHAVISGPDKLRDYLHVTDAGRAVIHSITDSPGGIFHIGSGKPISIRTVSEQIASRIDPKSKIKFIPSETHENRLFDVTKMKHVLKFTPEHTFPDGLDEMISWHKNTRHD